MKDDRTSSVMQDDGSRSAEDERDDFRGAQQRDQRSPGPQRKSPSPQTENSSSDEEEQEQRRSSRRQEEERRSRRRREKTRGNMQVEPTDAQVHPGHTAYVQVEPDTSQTAYTSRRQKTGSAMQIESRDPRSYPIQTSYTPTRSNVQIEPTDVQVHPGQTAHLPTGSDMQVESLDPRSRPIQTTCTPPDMAARQEKDNGHQDRRQRSLPDTAARMTVDASTRPTSGRATAQPEEDKIAVEEELSSLQLKPEMDLQSPTITKRQQECRVVTQAVIEQEPRGKSSAMEISDQEQPSANKLEVAERHQQLTISQEQELEHLRRLAADVNQRLTSGFYPTPYVEQGRPLTPGVAAGPEMQLYDRYGAAYSAHHYRPGFYSPPGYTQCVYPNGVQYTPFPEIQRFSRPDNASYAYPHGVSYPSQEAEIRQVDKVLPEQQRSSDFSRQPEVNEKATSARSVVQFCDTMPENTVARPDSESRQNTTAEVPVRTPETGNTELEAIDTVYHTARRDNSS